MNFNIWTAEISVASKLLFFFIHVCSTILFEQSKCVDSIFTSDKRSITFRPCLLDQNQLGPLGVN